MRATWITLWVLVGCHPAGSARDSAEEPALLLGSSPVVRAGGTLWVVPEEVHRGAVVVTIDDEPVDPVHVHWDRSFALYAIPDDLPPGPVTVRAWRDDRPDEVELREARVVEPLFVDVTDALGLDFEHHTDGWPSECAEAMTGLGFADVDEDGDLDLFVGDFLGESALYRNDGVDGDGLPALVPATEAFGLTGLDRVSSASFADYDNDGDQDLFLGRRGANRLLQNRLVPDGVATFVDVTEAAGLPLDVEQRTMGVAWGDHDGDGDLDLYLANHVWCYPGVDDDPRNADALYRNDGGRFVDVTHLLDDTDGQVTGRYGFTALWVDHDRDGDQDLFVFNDQLTIGGRGVAWRNDGPTDEGHAFTEVTDALGFWPLTDAIGKPVNAMGAAVGDLNRDGWPDFAYTNIGPNVLAVSSVGPDGVTWADEAPRAGAMRSTLPWGDLSVTWAAHLFDADNDGDLDLFYSGGPLKGTIPQPHAFLENLGDGFVERTWEAGLEGHGHGKASALVDLDEDGFLDLVVANWSGRLEVYRNRMADPGAHWLRVDLVGDGERVNRDAFGAIVEVTTPDGVTQTCFRNPMPSLSATGDPTCHFGLGAHASVTEVRVFWPDGTRQTLTPEGVDRRVRVELP